MLIQSNTTNHWSSGGMASSSAMAAPHPNSGDRAGTSSSSSSPSPSPKGGEASGRCLCSPTTHRGSFRCRHHRNLASGWLRRSNSMPSSSNAAKSTGPVAAPPHKPI